MGKTLQKTRSVCRVQPVAQELFEAMRQIGAERTISKRRGSFYRGGESRECLKIKCSETSEFTIIGFANSATASSMPSTSPRRAIHKQTDMRIPEPGVIPDPARAIG